MSTIPVRNVYYLLSYAWDLLEEAEELAVDKENLPEVVDLLARLLIHGTQRALRRGLDRGYLPQTEILSALRGRVDFAASVRRLLLYQAKAQCDFEEFLPDLLHNQILKTTLRALSTTKDLAKKQRGEIHTLLRKMDGISFLQLRKAHFNDVRLHRNNAYYRLLMHICELVYDNMLVNEQTGQLIFRDFLRDDQQMARLFEAFIANFYRKETNWEVKSQERILWDTPDTNKFLPEMHADVILRLDDRVIVVECKYYQNMLQPGRWTDQEKLRSAHLYQITAYLENLQASLPNGQNLEGLLIYPTVNSCLQEDLILGGKRLRVSTIDLNQPWEDVALSLKNILIREHIAVYP